MISVYVIHRSDGPDFPINSSNLVSKIKDFLKSKNINQVEVVIAVSNEDEMKRLGKIYLKEEDPRVHNVLSFVEAEVKKEFIMPKSKLKKLGEVVVCYPVAQKEAKEDGVSTDDKVYELAEHGVKHLLGEHHRP